MRRMLSTGRCGDTRENRKMAAKPKMEICHIVREMTEACSKMKTQQTGQHGRIRSSALQATADDGTSQGRRNLI